MSLRINSTATRSGLLALTATGLITVCGGVNAQSTAMKPVVVTATRTAVSADETIAPVTVITRDDIEKTGALSVPEILRATPGVDVTRNGPYGKTSSVFMRGTESDHVLILIDGVRQYSATLGTTQLELLAPDQIERIEVLRGPRASLYGAEAIGGVIQIFTRRGDGVPTIDLTVGGGSDSTAAAGVGISGASGATRYNVRLSGETTDGIDALEGAQPDRDPYDNTSFSASVDHDFSDRATGGVNVVRGSGTTSYDNAFDTPDADHESDFVQQTVSVHGRFEISDMWSSSLRLSQSRDETDNLRNAEPSGSFNTRRNELAWQNDYAVGDDALITFGVDYSDDEVSGDTSYVVSERDNLGIYGEYQNQFGAHGLVMAIRSDDNEQFGSFTTGNIDYRYSVSESLDVVASYGRAYKAPSFNELYFPGFGNADLEVEESESVELGLRGRFAGGGWGVRAFRTDIDNLITFDSATFLPVNLDSAEITGIEADVSALIGGWQLRGALTLLDPEDSTTGKTLRRRAKQSVRVDASRDFGKFTLSGSLIYQGKRYEDAANLMAVDSYTVANVRGAWRFSDALSLEATVENLFDKDYETVTGYREKDRSFFLRLRYRQPLRK